MAHDGHEHGANCDHDHDETAEVEVVELETADGQKEDFAILEEIDFEGRRFAIMTPLAELEAHDAGGAEPEEGLSLEILEVHGDTFAPIEDEELAGRLMKHLDGLEAGESAEDAKG